MKIIYDENKIQEIKENQDKQNKETIDEYEKNYKKIIKITKIVAIISFLISDIGFYIAHMMISKNTLSTLQLFLFAGILTIPLATFVISLLTHFAQKENRKEDRENYKETAEEFSYPASVKYNLFIENKQLKSIVVAGNPNEEKVHLDISAINTKGELETIKLYEFKVSYSDKCNDIVVDLMNSQAIYPLKDKSQKLEFSPTLKEALSTI